MQSVECCLWFAGAKPHDAVRLTAIDAAEWGALAAWAVGTSGRRRSPMLADLLGSTLPIRLDRAGSLRLQGACRRVVWDSLDGPALPGFASLSSVVDQAAGPRDAGLAFLRPADG
jgi:hypothetical protein